MLKETRVEAPQVSIVLDGEKLTARYQTQTFLVHARDRTGKYAKDAHEEDGPNQGGFLLSVTIKDAHYDGPLVIPQDLREPYWTTYLNEYRLTRVGAGERYLWVNLSHGSGLCQVVLCQIKQCIAEVAGTDQIDPVK
jgi:hypothetical protein